MLILFISLSQSCRDVSDSLKSGYLIWYSSTHLLERQILFGFSPYLAFSCVSSVFDFLSIPAFPTTKIINFNYCTINENQKESDEKLFKTSSILILFRHYYHCWGGRNGAFFFGWDEKSNLSSIWICQARRGGLSGILPRTICQLLQTPTQLFFAGGGMREIEILTNYVS